MPISKLKASSIASGTLDNARISLDAAEIPALPTSKITSGTFDDARIAASNVSQHATSFDDNKLVNDLSTLGLRVYTQENLTASNTNSQYVDVFQDSSAISNLTNTQRNDSEYVSSVANSDTDNVTINTSNYQSWFDWNNVNNISVRKNTSGGSDYYNPTASTTAQFHAQYTNISGDDTIDDSEKDDMITALFTANSSDQVWLLRNDDTSNTNRIMHMNIGLQSGKLFKPTAWAFRWRNGSGGHGDTQLHGSLSTTGSYAGTFLATMRSGTIANGTSYNGSFSNNNFYDAFTIRTYQTSTNSIFYDSFALTGTTRTQVTSATGSFTGNNITASSTNKMGAVLTYQDFSGTNSLNTDIVLQLSADGGSNYSTATLTALPDFATGIKMAKVNDLSVTAGTSLKYKISFANQASGSKEARIRGVSLQY